MNSRKTTDLKVGYCSYEAAKFATSNWHYSHSMPSGAIVKIGVWEKREREGGGRLLL
jgi:hypothetical protein